MLSLILTVFWRDLIFKAFVFILNLYSSYTREFENFYNVSHVAFSIPINLIDLSLTLTIKYTYNNIVIDFKVPSILKLRWH